MDIYGVSCCMLLESTQEIQNLKLNMQAKSHYKQKYKVNHIVTKLQLY